MIQKLVCLGGLTRIGQIGKKLPIKERSGALADYVHAAELPTIPSSKARIDGIDKELTLFINSYLASFGGPESTNIITLQEA